MPNSLLNGPLKIATDGLHHLEEHVATATVHVEADNGSVLTITLQNPGDEWDPQSHGAESSGHFAVVTTLEMMKEWAMQEEIKMGNIGAVVG